MNYKELHKITCECEHLEMALEDLCADTPRTDVLSYHDGSTYPTDYELHFTSADAREHICEAIKAELREKTKVLKDFINEGA
ncbi:MAG: hypothetical protein J6T22_09425 [Bacteroidales bacterium]|nr:hypothetical protein [Bacteroidales bacterium]MBO7617414.1 hypothetical protein [Bacteroidales bacterium]